MKVLVPVDGSKHSSEGIKVASHYAKTKDAQLYLITVIPSVADIDLEPALPSWKRGGEGGAPQPIVRVRGPGAGLDIRSALTGVRWKHRTPVSF